MCDIIRKRKTGVFTSRLTTEQFKKYKLRENENFYQFVSSNKNYYYIISPRENLVPDLNGNFIIKFDRYFKSNKEIDIPLNVVSEKVKFVIDDNIRNKMVNLDGIEIKQSGYKIDFSLDNSHLVVLLRSSKKDLKKMRLSSVIFNYIFYLTGNFITQDGKVVYETRDSVVVEEHIYPKKNDYKCKNFSRFSVPITKELVERTLPLFLELYNKNVYPIETFLQTQTDIEYNIQQRVSLILNSMEGFIKRCMTKDMQKVPISKAKKKIILTSVKNTVQAYIKSDDFMTMLKNLEYKENIDIIQLISNTLGRFTEFSFDDILEISKEINPTGHNFVKSINMPVKFWKRCKDHRNFHAHLTEDNHKGFNGTQSLYAVYTLSAYFRLLVLEQSGLDTYAPTVLEREIDSINTWLEDRRISKEISVI